MTEDERISMRRFFCSAVSIILFVSLATAFFFGAIPFLSREAQATPHSGQTTGDEIWFAVDNPHVITANYTVQYNHTLTLEPGARIEIVENGSLRIEGRLIANGSQNTITFTSIFGAPEPEQFWEGIFLSSTSGKSVINRARIEYANYALHTGSSKAIISNLTVTSTWYAGIYVDGSSPQIYNNTITQNEGWGIKIEGNSMPVASHNTITFNGYDGIYTGSHSRPFITDNSVSSNLDCGIKSMGDSSPVISNNTISENSNDGIYIYSASPKIANNTIAGNNHTGIRVTLSSSAQIENNTISNNQKNGIVCLSGAAPEVKSNHIRANGQDESDLYPALYIDDSSPSVFLNNISGNYAHGIYMTNTAFPVLQENTVNNNYLGIYIEDSAPQIAGCLVSYNTHDGIFMESSSPIITQTAVSSNGDDGIQAISSYPFIFDCQISSNADHGIQSSSSVITCVNTSVHLSAGNDFYMDTSSHIYALNTTFDETRIQFNDTASVLEVQWYLTVLVFDAKGDRISGATVVVRDAGGSVIHNSTSLRGKVDKIISTQYAQSQVGKIMHTPHNISATRDGSIAYSLPDPTMDANKEITVTFPVDLGLSVPTGLEATPVPEGNKLNISWDLNPELDLTGYTLYVSLDNVSFDIKAVVSAPTTFYIDSNLVDGQLYFYRILAQNSTNQSGQSSAVSGTPKDVLPPSPPENLTVVRALSAESLSLAWQGVDDDDVMGYNVYRAQAPDDVFVLVAQLGLQTEYTDSGLETYKTYYYRVAAYDEVPNESELSNVGFNTTWDTDPPEAPEGLSVVSMASGNILNVSWLANFEDDLQYYTLYSSTNNITFNIKSTVPPHPNPSFLDTNLTDGTRYYYKVSASDTRPNESPMSESASAVPSDTIAPGAPTGLIVSHNPDPDALNLSWNPNTEGDVAGFEIYRSESSGGPYTLIATVGLASTFQDIGLLSDVVYYYVILAFDEVPNHSPFSNEANGTTNDTQPPAAPKNLTAAPMPQGNALNISWKQNTEIDLDHYILYRSTNNISFGKRATIPSGTSYFLDTGLLDATTYYYALSATDEVPNESPLSLIARGIPADILAPARPQGLSVTLGFTPDSLNLSWAPNTEPDLAGYLIYRGENPGGPYTTIASVGQVSKFQDTNLVGATTYYYVIQAIDEVPNFSPFSDEVSKNTTDYVAPSTPGNLKVTSVSRGNALNISWDASPEPDVESYVLYLSTDNMTFFQMAVVPVGTEFYVHLGLLDGITYFYVIYARDGAPNYSPMSDVAWGMPQDTLSPATPAGLRVVDLENSEGALNISWEIVTTNADGSECDDLFGYFLYRNDTGTWDFLAFVPAERNYFEDVNLSDGLLYNYSVLALDEVPNQSPLHPAVSNISVDDLPPAPPSGLDARATLNSGELNITWNPVISNLDGSPCTDLVNYTLYRNGTVPATWELVANISAGINFYLDLGLLDYIAYNYTICASDEVPNYSPLSSSDCGIPFDFTPPGAPTGLAVRDETGAEGALNISWDANIEVDLGCYLVYSNRSGVWEVVATVPSGKEYHVDHNLADGVVYYYNVSAVDWSGNEGNKSPNVGNVSVDDLSPSSPAGLVVKDVAGAEHSLNISWKPVTTNADGSPCSDLVAYNLYTNKSGVWVLLAVIPAGTEFFVDSAGLFDGPDYYFRISASDEIPNTSPNSSDANGASVDDSPPSAPTGLTVIPSPSGNALNIDWTESPESDVVSYILFWSTNNLTFDLRAVIPAGPTSFLDSHLRDGKTYYYLICAADEVPNYSMISVVSGGVPNDIQAPAAPTGLVITYGQSPDSLNISWNLNTEPDLEGYMILRSETQGGPYTEIAILGAVSGYVDLGLDDNVTYYYVVLAFDEVPNNSSYSNEVNITTKDRTPPKAPAGLKVTAVATGKALNLSWQANSEPDMAFYSVYCSWDNLSFAWLADISFGKEYYMHSGLKNGVTYYYLITASDAIPNESPLSMVVKGTPFDLVAPPPPTDFTVQESLESNELRLSWNASAGLDVWGYNVYRSLTKGGPYQHICYTGLNRYYVDGDVEEKTTYYYVITAVDEVPNESPYSTEAMGTTPDVSAPATPAAVRVLAVPAGNALNISWDAVQSEDIATYKVYRSLDNITFFHIASVPKGIEFYLDANLSDGKSYWYILTAVDDIPNESGLSSAVSESPRDTLSPSRPVQLTAAGGLVPDSVKLIWNPNKEEDLRGYTVYCSLSAGGPYTWVATLGLETTFYIGGLEDDTVFYFAIDAFDEVPNNSTLSEEAVWTTPDRTPPGTPTGLTASAVKGGGAVVLAWNPNFDSDLEYYPIYRGTDNVTFVWIANIAAGNTTYTDTGLVNGVTYYYTIAAADEVPNRSPLSSIAAATPMGIASPAKPMGMRATPTEGNKALLINWSASTEQDLLLYTLYRSEDNVTFVWIANISADCTNYIDMNVTQGKTYYYKLGALNSDFDESELSEAASGTLVTEKKGERKDYSAIVILLSALVLMVLFSALLLILVQRKGRAKKVLEPAENKEPQENVGQDKEFNEESTIGEDEAAEEPPEEIDEDPPPQD